MKLSKEDKLFSKMVREANNWTCSNCGAHLREYPQKLQCSHHVSRRFVATRWLFLNATAHCATCHRAFTDDPVLHQKAIYELIGEDGYKLINLRRHNQMWKQTKKDREEMYKKMREQYKNMMMLRDDGIVGEIIVYEAY